MNEFIADEWRAIFDLNGLRRFEDFWQREIDWFEKPNFRRGGWSGVGRWELARPEGGRAAVFVKRQENHVTRTWRHPIRGVATLRREFENLRQFREAGVPVPRLLYFSEQKAGGKLRAMLMTEELAGFQSLESWTNEWSHQGHPPVILRRRALRELAEVVARMHAHRLQHNCLYAKHVFVRCKGDDAPEVRLIDLEKAKRRGLRRVAVLRDLDTLNRHSPGWSRTDRARFLKNYVSAGRGWEFRDLWRALAARVAKKTG